MTEEASATIAAVNPVAEATSEVLILHTAEALEWAAYLQQILELSPKLNRSSILLYAVSTADQLYGYDNFESFRSCKCIVLLLTRSFLDLLCYQELHEALQTLLHPPHRVVVLLCGVSEEDVMGSGLTDWQKWRQLYAEDEPAVYISTIEKSFNDNAQLEADHERNDDATMMHISATSSTENPTVDEVQKGEFGCLTVQPCRAECGAQETLFIILSHKLDDGLEAVVEFSSEKASKRAVARVENEYTLSVTTPDMPPGVASVTLLTGQSRIGLKPVTFYTTMGEVSRLLENANDSVTFLCQAFNLTSNATESLDDILTDSFKSRLPATGLQPFGINQIEVEDMSANQRTDELPTLLHFAAKFGLKKLTSALLQCPGALQAYSVMNKHGEYPNTLAEKSGFPDLRQSMDKFVFKECNDCEEVYEEMTPTSSEDIYESMVEINPECAKDLYEAMAAGDENPEETALRIFFQGKPQVPEVEIEDTKSEDQEKESEESFVNSKEEDDPYNLNPEEIYDTPYLDSYHPAIIKRPPAPIPRPQQQPEKHETYISRVFSDTGASLSINLDLNFRAARPVEEPPPSTYDYYAGMKTAGQRQLVFLQEAVKVGQITVDEAVQEFKAWQSNREQRESSMRYRQEDLKRMRDSFKRCHKAREKTGKETDFVISAPLQRDFCCGANVSVECEVYESTPRLVTQVTPKASPIQRGNWKTGSTSSTSSSESNRLSTHSNVSSGTEPDFEEMPVLPLPPPRPLRPAATPPFNPSPRIPPPLPERLQENMYVSYPTRALPQIPPPKPAAPAPPVPPRMR